MPEVVAPRSTVVFIGATQHQRPTLPLSSGRTQTVSDTSRRQEEANRVVAFLKRLYEATRRDEHKAVDEVFEFMDDHLLAGQLTVCEQVFEQADPYELASSGVVSLLMVTQRAKGKIPSRAAFIARAEEAIARKEGLAEAKALLGKYR